MAENQSLLKRMIVSSINAREVESNRISRLLHDEVGQVLSAVGLQLDVLKLDYKKEIPEIVERVREIQQLLESAVTQVRAMSYDLNPAVVERAGFQSALDRLVGRYREQFPGAIRFLYTLNARPPLAVAAACYKIADLALENAVRHARAGRIEVHARSTAKGMMLDIRDDGCGFDPEDVSTTPGLGLLLIEHYGTQAPIRVSIKSSLGKGTLVRCSFQPPRAPKAAGEAEPATG